MGATRLGLTCAALLILAALGPFGTAVSAQSERIIYTFTGGSDGGNPQSGLVSDGKGHLYGTTGVGGASGQGTVYELIPGAAGTWTEKVIHSFAGQPNDGSYPNTPLIFDSKGNLYGTTAGTETAFELMPQADGTWTEKVLYSFTANVAPSGLDAITKLLAVLQARERPRLRSRRNG